MILKNRVIWSNNGVLTELSMVMNNHISGSKIFDVNGSQDYLFLGSDAPFNHRWVEVKVANTASLALGVDYWDGKEWVPVAEVVDETVDATGAKSLSQSGMITWVPDKKKAGWSRDDTKDSSSNVITGLGTITIYDLFWVRLRYTGTASSTTELSYMGNKFANDEDLYSLYSEFETTEAKERFKDGLTTWDSLHFEAAKMVIRDLKSDKVINSGNQILEAETFRLPAIHKVAELIYGAYGTDWKDDKAAAYLAYKQAMAADLFNVDINENALLEVSEVQSRAGRIVR